MYFSAEEKKKPNAMKLQAKGPDFWIWYPKKNWTDDQIFIPIKFCIIF